MGQVLGIGCISLASNSSMYIFDFVTGTNFSVTQSRIIGFTLLADMRVLAASFDVYWVPFAGRGYSGLRVTLKLRIILSLPLPGPVAARCFFAGALAFSDILHTF